MTLDVLTRLIRAVLLWMVLPAALAALAVICWDVWHAPHPVPCHVITVNTNRQKGPPR